ncbi:MAG: MFS transporter [Eubacteriales bacterium]
MDISYNRAKIWQIALFALNNVSTNLFLLIMGSISYYANGIAGIAALMVSFLIAAMCIFDGITDPAIGFIIDKTDSKFGKFRPSMVIGYGIMATSAWILFHTLHQVPEGWSIPYFILIYGLYIVGYTFQTACTKSAQSCLTNDPKQRPLLALFDGLFSGLLFGGIPIYTSMYLEPKHGGFTLSFFEEYIGFVVIGAGICTALAVFGIREKDTPEFYQIKEGQKVTLQEYWDVICHNRPLSLLVFSAATDKLAATITATAVVPVMVFGILAQDFEQYGKLNIYTAPLVLLFLAISVRKAQTKGQKKTLVQYTILSIFFASILGLLMIFGDMTQLDIGFTNFNLFSLLFVGFYVLMRAATSICSVIVVPMIADCTDYEIYRSGNYIPGMIGTLFSFVDKMVSSLATVIIGLSLAMIGFGEIQPSLETPNSPEILAVSVFLLVGMPILGWVISLIAMKFYPLTAEKMCEIQGEIEQIKKGIRSEQNEKIT